MDSQDTILNDEFEKRKVVLGVKMTLLYSLVYAGFVALSVFKPTAMAGRAVLGLNVAVAYGLGLIIIAVIFALIYNILCRFPAEQKGE